MTDEREIAAHYLDDPDYDIGLDDSEGHGWGVVFIHFALIAATVLLWQYLKPPPIIFPVPQQPIFVERPSSVTLGTFGPLPTDWRYDCLSIDGAKKVVTANPACFDGKKIH